MGRAGGEGEADSDIVGKSPKVAGCSSYTGERSKSVLWSCESVVKDLRTITLCCLLSALPKYPRYLMPLVVLVPRSGYQDRNGPSFIHASI